MNPIDNLFFLICIPVIFAFINHKLIKIQPTIAILIGGLCSAITLNILQRYSSIIPQDMMHSIQKLDFSEVLIKGMLHFLLFAGAMQIDLQKIKSYLLPISMLAIVSTLTSALLIGLILHPVMTWINHPLPWNYCFLFGALISPTDPIAVIANMISLKAPKAITTLVAGEALFNDGVAIVLYTTLYHLAFENQTASVLHVFYFFMHQCLLGSAFGIILGIIGSKTIQTLEDDNLQVMTSIVLVIVGYAFANSIHISGPLAMVFAGLLMGNKLKKHAFLRTFWLLIDEFLNLILFLLIGLELVKIHILGTTLIAPFLAIFIVIFVRFISVSFANACLIPFKKTLPFKHQWILMWGGLRGGLALGLALALPHNPYFLIISNMTFSVVIFSLLVQGLTVNYFIKRL
jgi:monovalent cation:H+ antiporter, CPA1 family